MVLLEIPVRLVTQEPLVPKVEQEQLVPKVKQELLAQG
jgi:hypothetical protein